MGGGVSTLPDQVTEDDLQQLCSERADNTLIYNTVFNSNVLYTSLKGPDNTINKQQLLTIILNSSEQEVMRFFLSQSNGEMDSNAFIEFCRMSKVLSKGSFNKTQALKLYTDKTNGELLNYRIFRFDILPAIASSRGKDIKDIILRLSRLEPPLDNQPMSPSRSTVRVSTGCSRLHSAVLRIQAVGRIKLARTYFERQRILNKVESTPPVAAEMRSSAQTEAESEVHCKDMFEEYSINGEMNIHDFVRLCYDTSLIPFDGDKIDFTAREARFLFQKVVAMYFDPKENLYRDGVLHGKRILFPVFRNSLIPEIADTKSVSETVVVGVIAEGPVTKRMYNAQEGPRILSLLNPETVETA
mmetsp:Transcript_4877/g.7426  ORF Transcript_4877/g.7426 Transcript_4877/m.7426 type:complete len:357 (+) Transcript_4877:44-1114(+)|eukprot:CAMPEP_0185032834 /NCGR_PEP_ID=MMETSP1103-20130426/21314_1 /TAXON_ID=36769 /ORGANISM="Paraphysomonas bandaiensis, Strain Caron Lab Isolate" /LENGTH=356 /DNA_ID=CAMNT_0027568887 /DNA_START=35 /DNA_END=1105 /DNA_ORIENTATION=+